MFRSLSQASIPTRAGASSLRRLNRWSVWTGKFIKQDVLVKIDESSVQSRVCEAILKETQRHPFVRFTRDSRDSSSL